MDLAKNGQAFKIQPSPVYMTLPTASSKAFSHFTHGIMPTFKPCIVIKLKPLFITQSLQASATLENCLVAKETNLLWGDLCQELSSGDHYQSIKERGHMSPWHTCPLSSSLLGVADSRQCLPISRPYFFLCITSQELTDITEISTHLHLCRGPKESKYCWFGAVLK